MPKKDMIFPKINDHRLYYDIRATLYDHGYTILYDPFADDWHIFQEDEFIGEVDELSDIPREPVFEGIFTETT